MSPPEGGAGPAPQAPPRRSCASHPRRGAVTACVTCEQGICRDCLVHTTVGFKCPACTGARPDTTRARSGGRRGRLGAVLGRVPRRGVVAAAVVGVAAIAAWAALGSRGGGDAGGGERSASGEVREVAVEFPGAGGSMMQATLDLPAGTGPHPAVVVLGGFGATNRDGIVAGTAVADPFYRDVGRALAARGFAVLRYDKRGRGDNAVPDGAGVSFDERTEDAVRAVDYLQHRPDVDRGSVAVVGHDEGGIIALRIADGAVDLAGLVLVNTAGRPLADVLVAEYRAVGDPAHTRAAEELEQAFAGFVAGGEIPRVGPMLQPIFAVEPPGYLREILVVDPAEVAARATAAPVLIVHGEADSSINSDDVAALRGALTSAPHVEVLSVAGAGHTLLRGEEGAAPVRDTEALGRIVAWLADTVGAPQADEDAETSGRDPAAAQPGEHVPAWRPVAQAPIAPRISPESAWTGSELIVWGGARCTGVCDPDEAEPLGDGAAYDPATDRWRTLADAPLSPRFDAAGPRRPWPGFFFVWGGDDGEGVLADGAVYDPVADTWREVAPSPLAARSAANAVWTGREVIVWGGTAGGRALGDGAAYDPATDRWRPIADAPLTPRLGAVATWSGEELVVWGGQDGGEEFADGAAYDPVADRWRPLAASPLTARLPGGGAWTGSELLVLGGQAGGQRLTDGAAYDPARDAWRALTSSPVVAREGATSVWTGRELVVYGGVSGGRLATDGAAYDPAADEWRPLPPWPGRVAPTALWTGEEVVFWGGLLPAPDGLLRVVSDGVRLRLDTG